VDAIENKDPADHEKSAAEKNQVDDAPANQGAGEIHRSQRIEKNIELGEIIRVLRKNDLMVEIPVQIRHPWILPLGQQVGAAPLKIDAGHMGSVTHQGSLDSMGE
jgi:hypothetical protein